MSGFKVSNIIRIAEDGSVTGQHLSTLRNNIETDLKAVSVSVEHAAEVATKANTIAIRAMHAAEEQGKKMDFWQKEVSETYLLLAAKIQDLEAKVVGGCGGPSTTVPTTSPTTSEFSTPLTSEPAVEATSSPSSNTPTGVLAGALNQFTGPNAKDDDGEEKVESEMSESHADGGDVRNSDEVENRLDNVTEAVVQPSHKAEYAANGGSKQGSSRPEDALFQNKTGIDTRDHNDPQLPIDQQRKSLSRDGNGESSANGTPTDPRSNGATTGGGSGGVLGAIQQPTKLTRKSNKKEIPRVLTISIEHGSKLQPYGGGAREDLKAFQRAFNDRLRLVSEDNKGKEVDFLLAHLHGEAREAAGELQDEKANATAKDVFDHLTKRFEGPVLAERHKEELHTTRQLLTESVSEFYNRICRLTRRAHAEDKADIIKKTIKERFVFGLQDEMRKFVRLLQPKTPQEAYEYALSMERETDTSSVSALTSPMDQLAVNALTRSKESSMSAEIQELRNQISELTKLMGRKDGGRNGNGGNKSSQKSNVTCHYCQKVGHYKRECRKRMSDEQNYSGYQKPQDPVQNHRMGPGVNAVNDASESAALRLQLKQRDERIRALLALTRGECRSDSDESDFGVKSLAWASSPEEELTPSRSGKEHRINVSRQPMVAQIPITANNVGCSGLVDTGASISIANMEMAKAMGLPELQGFESQHALGIAGNAVEMLGSAIIPFKVGPYTVNHRIHFTQQPCTPTGPNGYSFILGNDFLCKLPRFYLDYDTSEFYVGEEILPMGPGNHRKSRSVKISVLVAEDTIIPAHSEGMVKCNTAAGLTASTGVPILVESYNFPGDALSTAPAVVQSNNIKLLITNSSEEEITLKKNQIAGKASLFGRKYIGSQCFDNTGPLPSVLTVTLGVDPEFKINRPRGEDISEEETAALQEVLHGIKDMFSRSADEHANRPRKPEKVTDRNIPLAMPTAWVSKKDGALRICLDFRKLNKRTTPKATTGAPSGHKDNDSDIRAQLDELTKKVDWIINHLSNGGAGPGEVVCHYCQRKGHIRVDCRKRQRDEKYGNAGGNSQKQSRKKPDVVAKNPSPKRSEAQSVNQSNKRRNTQRNRTASEPHSI